MADKPDIHVGFEYGTLKEVIVGIPLMIYPDLEVADWAQEALRILPEYEKQKFVERSGQSTRGTAKETAMEAENQALINILQKHVSKSGVLRA
jgi:hypothetical protein